MKKTAIIILSVSVAVLLICILIPVILLSFFENNNSIGIIGGADGPTAIMISNTAFNGAIPMLVSFAIATALCCVCCLAFSKTVREHCTLKTSGIALSLSACTSLLFYCLLCFASCFIMTSPQRHPIAFPISIIVGIISAVSFVLLLSLYIKARRGKREIKGVLIDIVVFVLYFVPFFLLFDFIRNIIA